MQEQLACIIYVDAPRDELIQQLHQLLAAAGEGADFVARDNEITVVKNLDLDQTRRQQSAASRGLCFLVPASGEPVTG